ncbi:ABC transporter substrate-binding protein [Cohnella pontilimi]|uniref:ABC transporter substrate-binding protein n=1 Tax=Cohnella pontilimi TaxID=2564100 RepID=A0A4U0FJ22_9BACL|nr:metal ABC transporter substrate-binding protein [Cohnella pontilimi]TJY44474.1 ABC transporter substrate-binding protein [Cohnella pontilimi]
MKINPTSKKIHPLRSLILLAALAIPLVLSACGNNNDLKPVEGKVNVVTTLYPLYYFASEIGGEDARVVNLVPTGVEPHDWTPKSRDIQIASEAQMLLFNGAGLEGWKDGFLKGLNANKSRLVVEASQGIELIRSEGDGHGADEHADEHGLNVDPHTWVSPKSALKMAENIRDAYVQADPAHQAAFESRYNTLRDKLQALDQKFTAELAPYKGRGIVVSHQAFGYLCRDYGLNQTALMGLSPDAEPRSQDIVNIIQFVKEHQIKAIFFEELVSNKLTETVAKETNAEMLVLNPVEGLTPEQEKAGDDYFSLMAKNLQNLKKALQ